MSKTFSFNNILYTLNEEKMTAAVADNRENTNFNKNLVIPEFVNADSKYYKVIEVVDYAFRLKPLDSIKLPDSIEVIGDRAFDMTYFKAENLTLPKSLRYLGYFSFTSAFYNRIFIPENVEYIGHSPFANVKNLTFIEVDPNNKYFCNDFQGILYDKKQTTLIQVPDSLEIVNIPYTVSTIGNYSIGYSSITSVIYFNGNIKKYHYCSFYDLHGIKTIYYFGESIISQDIFTKINTEFEIFTCFDYSSDNFGKHDIHKLGYCSRRNISCHRIRNDTSFNLFALCYIFVIRS